MQNVSVAVKKKSNSDLVNAIVGNDDRAETTGPLFNLVSERKQEDFLWEGAQQADLDRGVERMITISVANGELVFGDKINGKVHTTSIEGRLLRTALLHSPKLEQKILIVVTHTRTYFNMMPGSVRYGFYVPATSSDFQAAVLNLLSNNLARGVEIFEKTSARLGTEHRFFWELLQTAYPEGGTVEFLLGMGDRNVKEQVKAKLSFVPGDLSKTVMKIAGYNYDFDFVNYPHYYAEAFKRARIDASKVARKVTGLAMDRAAIIKPKQQSRKAKEAETLANAAALIENASLQAPGTLPATVPQAESKPAKLSKTAQLKAAGKKVEAPKEGKKKKEKK